MSVGGVVIVLFVLVVFAAIGLLTCGYFLFWVKRKALKTLPVPEKFFRNGLIGGVLLLILLQSAYWLYQIPTEKTRIEIDTVYTACKMLYRQGAYDLAFHYLSPAYRETHTVDDFISDFGYFSADPSWEHLTDLARHRTIDLTGNTAHLVPNGGVWSNAIGFDFEHIKGRWFLTGHIQVYLD